VSTLSETTETRAAEAPVRPAGAKGALHWLVDAHWLGRWRSPLVLKLWRYGAGSVVAFVVSTVTVTFCYSWLDLGAITSSTIAFVAGAVPNWVLNRRWAWQKRGRDGVGKETTLYVFITLLSWGAYTGVTKAAALASSSAGETTRDVLVTLSYMAANLVFAALKYLAYDRIVFVERPASSRSQVDTMTRAKRQP
jgi:putative flippase GtrA